MPFFDAHCDTIGKIWEGKADFAAEERADGLHVTLPGLRKAGMCAQVFASCVWSQKYKGTELGVAVAKVEAVRRLCADFPADLFLATTGAQIDEACGRSEPQGEDDRIAVIAGLEGADPLLGDAQNLVLFYGLGVRLLTLAWGDNAFCGSVFGGGGGLTTAGADLVAACEDWGVLVDVSHASDQAFADVCRVATRPFVASHSNCRSLCPNPRNLTDEMIREVGSRGGVVGISVAPGFLSADFFQEEKIVADEFFRSVAEGTASVEEAGQRSAAAVAHISPPRLESIVDHVFWAINVGGEDTVGLGGDLDGIDALPLGLEGVGDYPRIAGLLTEAGLTPNQVDKVCYGNFARVFRETVG